MKAIIIDDEPDAVEALHLTLMEICPEVAVAGKYTDPVKGLSAIRDQKPDLVFLDIEMPVLNGFQLLEELGDIAGADAVAELDARFTLMVLEMRRVFASLHELFKLV